jgi:glucokinase
VYRAAGAGDAVALAIAAQVGAHLARAIRGIALSYGIDRVVIGGGMSRAGEPFLRPILDELERERAASPLITHALTPNPVELLPADSDPGAWGAVVVARAGLRDGTAAVPEREVAND